MIYYIPSIVCHTCWYLALLTLLLCLPAPAGAVDVLDQLNDQRMRMGLYPLLPDANLQLTAEESARRQSNRGGKSGHTGTLQTGSAEGVGRGRVGPTFRFGTCFHMAGDYTTSYRYAGAAIVGGYAALSLDKDRSRGAIGSAKKSVSRGHGNKRRWLFRRRR